jgi:molybdopterin synthase catalytic subunit
VNPFRISDTQISIDECYQAVLAGESGEEQGAVALFVGRVRNHNAGEPITLLEYEAYPSMAEREMATIAAELSEKEPRTRLACIHRVGALKIGDIAVVCAVSSPHRDAAFTTCRVFIDLVKQRVPVWKREHGPNGPYWVGWRAV